MSTIKVFKDESANSIFIEDANGAQFLNSLQATLNGNDLVQINDLAKGFEIVSNALHTDFVDENDRFNYKTFVEQFHGPAEEIGFNFALLLTNLDEHNYRYYMLLISRISSSTCIHFQSINRCTILTIFLALL